MVVNPYLVHAYWDVDLTRLPATTSSAALRFHDVSQPFAPDTFDVEVDLRARNWYVDLWGPARSYYAELGTKTAAGDFTPIVRSNSLETPRAWPMADTDSERREGVPQADRPVFLTPADLSLPAAETATVGTGSAAIEPHRPAQPRLPDAVGAMPRMGSGGAEAPVLSRDREEAVVDHDERENPFTQSEPRPLPKRVDAAEILERRLSELYALRQWQPRIGAAVSAWNEQLAFRPPARSVPHDGTPDPSPGEHARRAPAVTSLDLTALAEHRFRPGFSSLLSTTRTPEGHPG